MKKVLVSIALITISFATTAQVGIGTASPEATAVLEVVSTDKGLLMPRMTTTQRAAINSPATGLMVFDTTTNSFWYYDGTIWKARGAGKFVDGTDTNDAVYTLSGNIGIGTSTPNRPFVVGGAEQGDVVGIRGGTHNQVNIARAGNASWGLILGQSDGALSTDYHFSTSGLSLSTAVINFNNDALHFGTNDTARMTIDHNGNVGIGSSSPGSKLAIVGLPEYADNTAATSGGLSVGDFYRTSDGTLKVVF
jgi:hypothetical protein